jgi:hypothetical protein
MRLALVLLAVAQHSRRVAASPTSPAPSGSPEDVAALRAALQRQLTPSCCAQLLQRLAPVVWVVLSVHPTPATLLGLPEGDLCMAAVVEGMMALTPMCCMFGPDEQPAHALGECWQVLMHGWVWLHQRLFGHPCGLSGMMHTQSSHMQSVVHSKPAA